jgi:hypothetical protein
LFEAAQVHDIDIDNLRALACSHATSLLNSFLSHHLMASHAHASHLLRHIGARTRPTLRKHSARCLVDRAESQLDRIAKELGALAKKDLPAGLARAATVKSGEMKEGGVVWVLLPAGADASSTPLASLRAAPDGMLYGAAAHPALPLLAAAPLVRAALHEKKNRIALAAIPGLCPWATGILGTEVASIKDKFGEVAYEAAEAIALGMPRKGHSVLGQGTFRDAKPVWWGH